MITQRVVIKIKTTYLKLVLRRPRHFIRLRMLQDSRVLLLGVVFVLVPPTLCFVSLVTLLIDSLSKKIKNKNQVEY